MMEFTLSKVCMCICGIMLMGSVIVPMAGMMDSETERGIQERFDDLANSISMFSDSGNSSIVIDLSMVVPLNSVLSFNGNIMTLEHDGKTFISVTSGNMSVSSFTSADTIELKKDGGTIRAIHFENVSAIFLTESVNLSTSAVSL